MNDATYREYGEAAELSNAADSESKTDERSEDKSVDIGASR